MRTASQQRRVRKKFLDPQGRALSSGSPLPHQAKLPSQASSRLGTSRAVAHAALVELDQGRGMADEILDRLFLHAGLEQRDRGLTMEFTYGVLRNRAALDWRLAKIVDRGMHRLPMHVRNALRLGAYQLLYLERIPPSAAVNETVSVVKSGGLGSKRWANYVNAVLRALSRDPVSLRSDPSGDGAMPLSIRYSCPDWLVDRWVPRFGLEQTELLCRAIQQIPPLTFRANTLKVTRENLVAELAGAGYRVKATSRSPVGLVMEKCGPVSDIPQFTEGLFYVEDEAGQLVPPLLNPQPGERILDACAAPGGKATHLAALMENRGEIVAMDSSSSRLRLLQDNAKRLDVKIISPLQCNLLTGQLPVIVGRWGKTRVFDAILVDAPCSGLGVLKRHPEGKWFKGKGALHGHRTRQLQLLKAVCNLLRPGGRLVYSTCSTEPEENEHVIDQFCRQHGEFERECVEPWLPPAGRSLLTGQGDLSTLFCLSSMDAFFAARLRKAAR